MPPDPRLRRIALEPVAELVAGDLLHERLRLGVAELGLGLALELRLGELDGDDRGEPLAHVVAGEVVVLLLDDALLARVAVDERRQRGAEALFVGAALVRVDRVGVGVHGLGVGRRPLHRDLEGDPAVGVLGLEGDDLLVDEVGLLRPVEVLDVVDESTLVEIGVGAGSRFLGGLGGVVGVDLDVAAAQVGERDAQSLVEERVLLESGAEGLVVELDGLEDVGARPEGDRGARLITGAALGERRVGDAHRVGLRVDSALTSHLDVEPGRERIDHRGADAVEAARHGVPAAAELAAGVQHGEHDLDRGAALGLVDVDRDASTVVGDPDAAVGEDRDVDRVAVAGEGLVDRVVDDLVDEVVEASGPGRADVHAGPLANRFEALEYLDLISAVFGLLLGLRGFGCHV
jgi:hypothetical protein